MNRLEINDIETLHNIIEQINIGVLALDEQNQVVGWNRFMVEHSTIPTEEILGRDLFTVFPDLPRQWMELKFRSVRLIKNYSFVSWTQKPYLFKFKTKRMTRDVNIEFMHQDCTFIPVENISTKQTYICITISDMTDAAVSQIKLSEISDKNKTLEQISIHDGLTALYNRAYVENQISLEFNKARRYGNVFSLIFFDIDKFKRVNDTYGHLAGDQVLKNVSDVISDQLRDSDVLGRYGGEEFLILASETDGNGAIILAERLREAIEETYARFEEKEICVTISLGVVAYKNGMKNHLQMIHEADIALYHSKTHGRNAVSRYRENDCELIRTS